MRMQIVAIMFIGALLTSTKLLSEETKKDDTKSEIKKLQGLWAASKYVENGEGEGEEVAPQDSTVRWVFKDTNISMLADVEDASAKGTFKLNTETDPKTIDLVFPASS